ncbi:hypothetical protein Nepgr_000910 [Nepenthes gracilis]|uniref:U-box domain-containing protein n=1 Tax=Nepenthes gracilis TaxID=150966 RepID=A0AAD3P416_NEPGR|nr:hypothetical protein Nepgr_000910 [Nepenthes gracilis]
MKTQHHHQLKIKPLFSCAFFRNCTQTVHSPTAAHAPPLALSLPEPPLRPPSASPPLTPQPPPPPPILSGHNPQNPDSDSSSSSNSHSFTQWRFPPTFHRPPPMESHPPPTVPPRLPPPPRKHPEIPAPNLEELFHAAEIQFTTGSESERFAALHMLEHSLVPNPPADSEDRGGGDGRDAVVPAVVIDGVVGYMKQRKGAKSATKVLLALCLAEKNRHVAVERGAVGRVVESLADLEGAPAERALAALELMCTVAEGAAEVKSHALAVPMLVAVMGNMEGRGREYAISVLAVIFGGAGDQVGAAPPEEVARAVVLAMQGDCSARGKRKGAQLLKTLQENGRLDSTLA